MEVAIVEQYNLLSRVTLIPTLSDAAIAASVSVVVRLCTHALFVTSTLSRALNNSFITSGTQKLLPITFAVNVEL